MHTNNRDDVDRRVVITGMGIVTTIGENLAEYFDSLVAGRSGITRWKQMDERIYSKIGGDMSDFDLQAHLARIGPDYPPDLVRSATKLLRPAPLPGQLTSAAALQAFVDAALPSTSLDRTRVGHVVAGHNLNGGYMYEQFLVFIEEPEYIDPLYGVVQVDTDVVAVVSELLGLQGPSFSVGGACSSGNMALLAGLDLVRSGRADAVLVSGAPADLNPIALQGFAIINALSYVSFNEEPTRASRPFDARREGFVPGQGSGAILLETLAGARSRGARIYAELLGGASNSDASRLTQPNLDGQVRAMRSALQDAGITPEQVDYVNAHGTSTPLGDSVEVVAIKTLFGDHAYRIPVNSTKSLIGHHLTAAGVVELIATILEMEHGILHPTINQEEPDPELDLDFVPNQAREHHIDIAISNSFGFGGFNSCVVVGRAP